MPKRIKTIITYDFVVEADTQAEVIEAGEILMDELDGLPDSVIDIISHPGNYDVKIKHAHKHTEVYIGGGGGDMDLSKEEDEDGDEEED